MTLRRTLATAFLLVGLVALAASLSLIVLTSYLQTAASTIGAAVEGVHQGEAAQLELILHQRARDPARRMEIEGRLRRALHEARASVSTDVEARSLAIVDDRVSAYLSAPTGDDLEEHDAAVSALEDFIRGNVSDAQAASATAVRLRRVGARLGVVSAALLPVIALVGVWWLRSRVILPLFAIVDAIRRFTHGSSETRLEERGPVELRTIAACFNEMANRLAERRNAQLAFMGGVAHDLRNPLSSMKLAAGAFDPERPLPSEERVRNFARLVSRQTERLHRMLGDLLDASRIESGALEVVRSSGDLREVVRGAVDLFEGTSSDHTLRLEIPDGPVFVECDGPRIEQVVTNLVSNAIKYSPQGGQVVVGLRRECDGAVIDVIDGGLGIPPGDEERVFEPFRRAARVRDDIPGVGLGLSVSRRIVQAHEGSIVPIRRPEGGTIFRVRLPLGRLPDAVSRPQAP